MKQRVSVFALYHTGDNFQKQFSSTLPDLHLWESIIIIIIIIIIVIVTIIMVEVLSNLQFNFHHKLPL